MIGKTLHNRYHLQAELGRGGVAVVYRAHDTLLERDVAVKVLSATAQGSEGRARILREARAAAHLNHPNIVTVFDAGEIEDAAHEEPVPYIVMELVDGPSLHDQRPTALDQILAIVRQVCAALEHAHAHGIIHRDLKPENVLLTADGIAKLSDFGLARSVASRLTREGTLFGTVYYIAPEQALGGELDGCADLYALGVMFYELTTGQLPFQGADALAVVSQHLHAPVVPPSTHQPGLPPALEALITRLLSKDPRDRPASARAVLETLERLEGPGEKTVLVAESWLDEQGQAAVELERPVFVARESELARLHGYLDDALAGKGRVVFVTGGPGRGKTALLEEFARRAQDRCAELVYAGGNCNAHTGLGDPYLPFREIIALLTGDVDALWNAGAISRGHAHRLWGALPLVVRALVELGPDLIDTFIPGSELVRRATAYTAGAISGRAEWLARLEELVAHKAAIPHDPSLQQSALFTQYAGVMMALARERPLLLVLDDLQWTDDGSCGLLFHLGRRLAKGRILVVGAYRPEEVALGRPSTSSSGLLGASVERRTGWERHPLESVVHEFQRTFGEIAINLAQAEDRRFVEEYVDSEPNWLSAESRDTLYRQTRGHPLFTVELLHDMQERGDLIQDDEGRWVEGPALDWERLPNRVEAVIAERVARLDQPSREALRVASVEGETFTAEVVAGVRSADEREIIRCLSGELERRHRLIRAQEIQRLGARRLSRYRFLNIMFQSYLYHDLDPVERVYLHEAVGTALEGLYGEGTEEIAEALARHFQEAGIADKAVAYLLQAGEKAKRRSANEAAITHFTRGLELLMSIPESPERTRRELDLLIALGVPLVLTRGHAAADVERTYARAVELSTGLRDNPQRFHALVGLRRYYLHRGQLQTAHELGEQLLALVRLLQDASHATRAHMMHGETLLRIGEFVQARDHFERGIALYDPRQHQSHMFRYGNDTGVLCHVFQGLTLWQLGYPDQALQMSLSGLSRAQELSHPFTLVCARYFTAALHYLRREMEAAQDLVDSILDICQDRNFALYSAWGAVLRGRTLVEQGAIQEGLEGIRQGLDAWRAMEAELLVPQFLGFLAEAHAKAGQAGQGLTVLSEALRLADKNGERSWEAELYRLKGELLLMSSQRDGRAEECFQYAIEVACRQNARSWELRAATSLSRLWQEQGKREQARKSLQGIYGWFSEGFETPDLMEARALLDALA